MAKKSMVPNPDVENPTLRIDNNNLELSVGSRYNMYLMIGKESRHIFICIAYRSVVDLYRVI